MTNVDKIDSVQKVVAMWRQGMKPELALEAIEKVVSPQASYFSKPP